MRAIGRLFSCVLVPVLVLVSGRAYALNATAPAAIGPEGGWVTALAVSPAFDADGRAWLATFGGHLFSSSNAAGSWTPSSVGETDPVVEAMAASPNFSADRTVFAAADEGVFTSSDGGAAWRLTSAGLDHHFCRALLLSPAFASDRTAYVATDAGVYTSNDNGASWKPPLDDTRSVISLAEVTGGPDAGTLLAGLDAGGLEQSTDGGAHWQPVPAFPTSRRALAIVLVSGANSSIAVVGTDAGIWRRGDGQLSWQQVAASGDRVDALAAGRSTSSTTPLYAGSAGGHGVYASRDAGATWQQVGTPAVPYVSTLSSAGASTLVAGTTGGGVSISTDGGYTWTSSNHDLLAFQVQGLKNMGSSLFVAGNGGALERDDTSGTWRPLAISSHFVTSVDGLGRNVFAGTQDNGLMVSNDAGVSWRHDSLPSATIAQVAVSPSSGESVFAAGDYIYRSADAGATFQVTNLPGNDVRSFAFSSSFDSDETAFVGTVNHGVYRTVDGGSNWLPASFGLPSAPVMNLLVSPSFARDGTVYAATAGKGIYLSTDRGNDWSPLSPSPSSSVVDALAWTQSGELIAGTDHGIYLLQASGWSPLAGGWDVYVSALQDVVDRGTEYLYAGTTGQGVWVTTLGVPPMTATSTNPTIPALPVTVVPRPTATSLAAKTPQPDATPKPTPATHPIVLHLRVDPVPVVADRVALLSAGGPAGGRVQLRLQAGKWQRKFSGTLGKDGRLAFGFVSPPSQIAVAGRLTARGHTVNSNLLIPVLGP